LQDQTIAPALVHAFFREWSLRAPVIAIKILQPLRLPPVAVLARKGRRFGVTSQPPSTLKPTLRVNNAARFTLQKGKIFDL